MCSMPDAPDAIELRLREVFRAVFEVPDGVDVTGLRQLGNPSWDSLAHVTLVSAVESEFGIEIDPLESLELTSFEAVCVHLQERVG